MSLIGNNCTPPVGWRCIQQHWTRIEDKARTVYSPILPSATEAVLVSS